MSSFRDRRCGAGRRGRRRSLGPALRTSGQSPNRSRTFWPRETAPPEWGPRWRPLGGPGGNAQAGGDAGAPWGRRAPYVRAVPEPITDVLARGDGADGRRPRWRPLGGPGGDAQAGGDAGAPWGRRSVRQGAPVLERRCPHRPRSVGTAARSAGDCVRERGCGAGRRGRRRSMGPALRRQGAPVLERRCPHRPRSVGTAARSAGDCVRERGCGAGRRGRRRSMGPALCSFAIFRVRRGRPALAVP